MPPTLVITVEGASERFTDGPVEIGRRPSCAVCTGSRDLRVSSLHGRFVLDASGWVYEQNPAALNGSYWRDDPVTRLPIAGPTTLVLGARDGVRVDAHVEVPADVARAPRAEQAPNRGGDVVDPTAAHPRRSGGIGSGSVLAGSAVLAGVVRIGRAADNDLVLDDATVSRHHAELRAADGHRWIVDLNSRNGTFVEGARVSTCAVGEGSRVRIGAHELVIQNGRLDSYREIGATLDVRGLVVEIGDKRLLEDVTFSVRPGQLVAVVGPSGAGKSTLLRALTGQMSAAAGAVEYNGQDLAASIEALRQRIGVVPQDDILHTRLRLRDALGFAARLRFATDTTEQEQDSRIDEVLAELGIAHRSDLPIASLSGGQRKRASVAIELLTRPALLFLDEPTSGLDPGFERSVMELLRALADSGRTVMVVTHAVGSLALCDRVLFLAPGGVQAYYGPPAQALDHFGAQDYPEVFQRLESSVEHWRSLSRAEAARRPPVDAGRDAGGHHRPFTPNAHVRRNQDLLVQFITLLRRNIAVLRGSKGSLILLAVQAPVMALLLLLTVGTDNLSSPATGQPRMVLLLLTVGAIAMGLVNACREIVWELPIYRREVAVSLSPTAYLLSKIAYLSGIAAIQAAVFTVLVVVPQGVPEGSRGAFALGLQLFAYVVALIVAASTLGLLVSALVTSDASALVMIPVLIVAQIVFSDALISTATKPGLAQVAWVSPSYWGFTGEAATVDLMGIERHCEVARLGMATGTYPCRDRWNRTTANQIAPFVVLVLLAVLFLVAVRIVLRQRDPYRAVKTSARRIAP